MSLSCSKAQFQWLPTIFRKKPRNLPCCLRPYMIWHYSPLWSPIHSFPIAHSPPVAPAALQLFSHQPCIFMPWGLELSVLPFRKGPPQVSLSELTFQIGQNVSKTMLLSSDFPSPYHGLFFFTALKPSDINYLLLALESKVHYSRHLAHLGASILRILRGIQCVHRTGGRKERDNPKFTFIKAVTNQEQFCL